ncbi:hypothetical protein Goshw_028760, partial [Gossypium schwendimanii]|nr:hypothetical protein [Gossypium schwendimanii]
ERETDFQRYFHCSLKIDFPFLITGSCSSHSSLIPSLQVRFPEVFSMVVLHVRLKELLNFRAK